MKHKKQRFNDQKPKQIFIPFDGRLLTPDLFLKKEQITEEYEKAVFKLKTNWQKDMLLRELSFLKEKITLLFECFKTFKGRYVLGDLIASLIFECSHTSLFLFEEIGRLNVLYATHYVGLEYRAKKEFLQTGDVYINTEEDLLKNCLKYKKGFCSLKRLMLLQWNARNIANILDELPVLESFLLFISTKVEEEFIEKDKKDYLLSLCMFSKRVKILLFFYICCNGYKQKKTIHFLAPKINEKDCIQFIEYLEKLEECNKERLKRFLNIFCLYLNEKKSFELHAASLILLEIDKIEMNKHFTTISFIFLELLERNKSFEHIPKENDLFLLVIQKIDSLNEKKAKKLFSIIFSEFSCSVLSEKTIFSIIKIYKHYPKNTEEFMQKTVCLFIEKQADSLLIEKVLDEIIRNYLPEQINKIILILQTKDLLKKEIKDNFNLKDLLSFVLFSVIKQSSEETKFCLLSLIRIHILKKTELLTWKNEESIEAVATVACFGKNSARIAISILTEMYNENRNFVYSFLKRKEPFCFLKILKGRTLCRENSYLLKEIHIFLSLIKKTY